MRFLLESAEWGLTPKQAWPPAAKNLSAKASKLTEPLDPELPSKRG